MDKKEIFEWVSDVIDSCRNFEHLNNAEKLIELFYTMFGDLDMTNCLYDFHFKKHGL